jgi:hypothetical protein
VLADRAGVLSELDVSEILGRPAVAWSPAGAASTGSGCSAARA